MPPQRSFFDSKAVTDKLDPAIRKALSRFGAFVRTRARSSIRKRKKVSAAGSPPSSHKGDLKKILFGYDAETKSVVIGPILYGSATGAPRALEEGGASHTRDGKSIRVGKRPYMAPAFQTELAKLGGELKNLIK